MTTNGEATPTPKRRGRPPGSKNGPNTKTVGRKTLLTPEVERNIYESYRLGLSTKAASGIAKIGYQTLLTWMEEGKEEHEAGRKNKKAEFYVKMNYAIQQGKGELHSIIKRSGNATAILKMLQLRFPDEYVSEERIKKQVEKKIEHSGNVNLNVSSMTEEDLENEIAKFTQLEKPE